MKSLYVTFIPLVDGDGISKKVCAQQRAFVGAGFDMRLSYYEICGGVAYYRVGKEKLPMGNRATTALLATMRYRFLLKYIIKEQIDFLYIRYTFEASRGYIEFLKAAKQLGVKIYLEIPTYPYDNEFPARNVYQQLKARREKRHRGRLHTVVDRIVTFSAESNIFNTLCINISNGVDLDAIKLRTNKPQHDYIRLLAVATLSHWHGYDRLIEAIATYYRTKAGERRIYFDLVGEGDALEELKQLSRRLGTEEYITFHGRKDGKELNKIFEDADICVGSLGRFRSGITNIKPLKSVEYAARGMQFIYSETNSDFDNCNYIFKVSNDQSPINIEEIVAHFDHIEVTPQQIRNSVSHLSWAMQMNPIIATLQ